MISYNPETGVAESVRFLCGCDIPAHPKNIIVDNEMFAVCPQHRVRRYGWRGPLFDEYKSYSPDANFDEKIESVKRPNWSRSSRENEREFWRRLGIDIIKLVLIETVEDASTK